MTQSTKEGLIILAIIALVVAVLYVNSGGGDTTDETSMDNYFGDGSDQLSGDGATVTSTATVTSVWAQAIQKFEGYFPGSRSYRDNNPGNLEEEGTAGMDGVYAKFATFADGQAALISDLTAKLAKYPGYTIQQIMARYSATDQVPYANAVASAFSNAFGQNITTSTTLSQLQGLGG